MKYAIVYSSKTGNTKLLAETICSALDGEDVYFGGPGAEALQADRLYVGFWTDKGDCDAGIAAFLQQLDGKQVFLFGTAGFGGSPEYFEKILATVRAHLPETASVVGTYMCQGKMPASVRERYVKMQAAALIENFDRALGHPDEEDLAGLKHAVQSLS